MTCQQLHLFQQATKDKTQRHYRQLSHKSFTALIQLSHWADKAATFPVSSSALHSTVGFNTECVTLTHTRTEFCSRPTVCSHPQTHDVVLQCVSACAINTSCCLQQQSELAFEVVFFFFACCAIIFMLPDPQLLSE